MSTLAAAAPGVWRLANFRQHPVRMLGIILHIVLRTLFGIFWLAAGANKIRKDWVTSDMLKRIFEDRLTEMHPDSFPVMYLQEFAIPLYRLIAVVTTALRAVRRRRAAPGPHDPLGRGRGAVRAGEPLARRLLRRLADPVLPAELPDDVAQFRPLAGARPAAAPEVPGVALVQLRRSGEAVGVSLRRCDQSALKVSHAHCMAEARYR